MKTSDATRDVVIALVHCLTKLESLVLALTYTGHVLVPGLKAGPCSTILAMPSIVFVCLYIALHIVRCLFVVNIRRFSVYH